MIRFLFFDLDGTLTDPYEGITNSILYALGKMGREPVPRESLRRFIGPPLIPSFEEFLGMTGEEARRAVTLYREYYAVDGLFENRVYDGTEDALRTLRDEGYSLSLATSKPEPFAARILERFSLDRYFDEICGASMDESRVKKGDVIRCLLGRLSEKNGADEKEIAARAAMIGDRRHDAEGAAECAIRTVGALWGYGSADELREAGCAALAASPADLPAAIIALG